jgi:3-hydroxyisobutyrate dehydrogenase
MAVRAWNRTREKAEPLAEDGVVVADTPARAAEGADSLITMLSDADAVAARDQLPIVHSPYLSLWLDNHQDRSGYLIERARSSTSR